MTPLSLVAGNVRTLEPDSHPCQINPGSRSSAGRRTSHPPGPASSPLLPVREREAASQGPLISTRRC